MKKIVALAFMACLALSLAWTVAYAKKEEQEVQTVSWFRDPANKAALEETLQQCRDNPGQLRDTPNCINARRAAEENFLNGGKYQKVKEPSFDF